MQTFVVGPKFKGVKMLPPGPHFVSCNATSSGGAEFAPTMGFFMHVAPRSVVVRRWSPQEELPLPIEDADEVHPPLQACNCPTDCVYPRIYLGRA